jgi:hypothetical protein
MKALELTGASAARAKQYAMELAGWLQRRGADNTEGVAAVAAVCAMAGQMLNMTQNEWLDFMAMVWDDIRKQRKSAGVSA